MAASSSSSSACAKKYGVFISFRGEDTREGFISHLYDALCRYSVSTYIDRELKKGEDISPSLIQAIQDSCGSLVVFSQNYASSKWCLNELLKILECRKQGHFVLPVFYNIDPSHVRKQTASYGEAFAKYEQDSNSDSTILQKWRAALTEAANIVGWDSRSRNHRDESKLIQSIVKDILEKLDHIYELSKLSLVGINKHCEHIEALLQKFHVVGIWGIGGIGKTTIAKAVYDKVSSQYDSCCFFENVREESQKRGLNQLQGNLISELLKDDIISINPHKAVRMKYAMGSLSNKKAFIVLDDVDNSMQLKHLGQECISLGPESKVIITARDKQLFTSLRVKHVIYEVERLNVEESLELFRLNAFSEDYPEKRYEEIIKKIVSYTQGTPLALKIIGSFLHSKAKEEWECEWKKLEKIPNKEIQKVLKLSFDGLSYEDQQIFLDIACFLKGENKEKIISLVDSYGFYGASGMRTLQDKALITVSSQNMVQMHDLIQKMGWEIVREESFQEPGKRSRLWDPKEVYDVLKNNKGTCKVEGMSLDMFQIKDLYLSANTFKEMTNLRYLNFFSLNFEESNKIHISLSTQLFSDKLRYFHWEKYPLRSLPLIFSAEKLVELNMPFSNLRKLWDGVQDLVNLKSLDLSESKKLIELPDFSKASNLKSANLYGCTGLRHYHSSLLSLQALETLNLHECLMVSSLPRSGYLKSLEYFNFKICSSVKEFSLGSEKITKLQIMGKSVEMLNSFVGHGNNLEFLTLCDSVKNIPNDLSKLTSLKSLSIGSRELDARNLHIVLESLPSLREIQLIDCLNLSQLPDNIKCLSCLTDLEIQNCRTFLYIYELPPSIKTLWLINCTSLETIITPKPLECMPSSYYLINCLKLNEHSLSSIIEVTYIRIKCAVAGLLCEDVSTFVNYCEKDIFFPRNEVGGWFEYRAAQNWINIEIPPHSHLLGFTFCCVLSPELLPHRGKYLKECGCYCYLENGPSTVCQRNLFNRKFDEVLNMELILDHVYIWYNRSDSYRLFDVMEKQKARGGRSKNLSFEFYVEAGKEMGNTILFDRTQNAIKKCGVWPIYASEYDISINDLERREGIKLGYRTDENDEQVEVQFDQLRPRTNTTGSTSSVSGLQHQDISSQNARFDLSEINSSCLITRLKELDSSTGQMELSLELGLDDKSKRCQDMSEPQPFQRCKDSDVSASGINAGCSESDHVNHYELQPLTQTNSMNEFIFQPLPVDISVQNAWLDSAQKNTAYLLDRFCELDNSITQFGQTGFCPDLNEMPTGGSLLDIDQQSPNLSLRLNQGYPLMNSFGIEDNSGLYASSNPGALPAIVQMAQENNVYGSSSFCLNQEDPQMNLHKGIEVRGSRQQNQHEQEQLVTGNRISCGCFIGLFLKPLWRLFSTP